MSQQTPPPSGTPQGFYPDSAGAMRWWDGSAWTEHTQNAPAAPAAPAKKSHTVRNVILGVIAVLVLFVVGCTALIGGAANEVSKSIEESDNAVGGPNNPLEITEGEAFSVTGFDYAAGWSIGDDGLGSPSIEGLKVTNNREDRDSALVEIKFMQGTEVAALVDCTTEPVAVGQTTTLDCFSSDEVPDDYDTLTINDSF